MPQAPHPDDFVETSVAHQIGPLAGWTADLGDEARAFALSVSSAGTLSWDGAAGCARAHNGWSGHSAAALATTQPFTNMAKVTPVLAQLQAAKADFDLLIDMQDRRVRSLGLPDGRLHPVVTFNRLSGSLGRILWPLPGFHDLDDPGFLAGIDPHAVPWGQKRDAFVWRGISGGRASIGKPPQAEGRRLTPLIKQTDRNEISPADLLRQLDGFPRFRFVSRFLDAPDADVGFVERGPKDPARRPYLAHLFKPRIPRARMQGFRYIAVLRGLDVASSFYWTMNSGSLGLVMQTPFETFASVHFRPWHHYVPFREDLSDFDARLDWCRTHDDDCRRMVADAASVCALLQRADLRETILHEVVRRLRARL